MKENSHLTTTRVGRITTHLDLFNLSVNDRCHSSSQMVPMVGTELGFYVFTSR